MRSRSCFDVYQGTRQHLLALGRYRAEQRNLGMRAAKMKAAVFVEPGRIVLEDKPLVATDLTARSDRAIARGFLLRIVHIVDDQLPGEFSAHCLEWAKRMLSQVAGRLVREGGRRRVSSRSSRGIRSAISCVWQTRAAQICSSSACMAGPPSLLSHYPDTTAGRVLSSSLVAALIVTQDATAPYRSAVIGVDFSIFSHAAVRQSMQVAPTASLHLLHAFHVPFKSRPGTESVADSLAYHQRLQLDTFLEGEMNALERRVDAPAQNSIEIDKLIEEGPPELVLRSAVRRMYADLLTIATHGRGVISRAIWGSVAVEMLSDPPCDVLVVKPF
jgi:nucleotide-binding universal stress UspA family protein